MWLEAGGIKLPENAIRSKEGLFIRKVHDEENRKVLKRLYTRFARIE
jgi:hypothetical protein